MKDIVFLFGAGASYGAGAILPESPPLGPQLYEALAISYPGSWGSLPGEVRETFKQDFESGMQLIYDQYELAIPALMREMAVYFIQFRPYERSSLYCRLVSDLYSCGLLERVLFSTLNYECVLEYSLAGQGHDIAYFDEGAVQDVPVWKLHGSCNMFLKGIMGMGITYGQQASIDGPAEAFLDQESVIKRCLVENDLAPIMCLYMKGKPINISPSIIKQVREEWTRMVEKAKAVVCIGVRPLPEDEHIWQPLSAIQAPIYFIGDKEALESWRNSYRAGFTDYIGAKFGEAYNTLIRRLKGYED